MTMNGEMQHSMSRSPTANRDVDGKDCGFIADPTHSSDGSHPLSSIKSVIGTRCFTRWRPLEEIRLIGDKTVHEIDTDTETAYHAFRHADPTNRTMPRAEVIVVSDETTCEDGGPRHRIDAFMADVTTVLSRDAWKIGFTALLQDHPQLSGISVTTYHELGNLHPFPVERISSDTMVEPGSQPSMTKTVEGYVLLSGREGGQGREWEVDDDGRPIPRQDKVAFPKDWHQYVHTVGDRDGSSAQVQLIQPGDEGNRETSPSQGVLSYYWRPTTNVPALSRREGDVPFEDFVEAAVNAIPDGVPR